MDRTSNAEIQWFQKDTEKVAISIRARMNDSSSSNRLTNKSLLHLFGIGVVRCDVAMTVFACGKH